MRRGFSAVRCGALSSPRFGLALDRQFTLDDVQRGSSVTSHTGHSVLDGTRPQCPVPGGH